MQRFFYLRPALLFPVLDRRFITLHGSALRCLRTPAEPVQESSHVITMIRNTEVLLDDLSDAARGPDLGRVTMSHRAPQQQPNQTPTLYRGQLGWPTRRGADLQCLDASATPSIAPAHDRTRRASEEPSDFIQRTPFVQQRQCTASPELEHVSRTLGSRHGSHLRRDLLLHSLRRSQ